MHCENTKIWPYCMTAAGLGLKLFDRVYNQASHWAFHEWIEYAKKHYMTFTPDGRLETMAMYYDPQIDHVHGGGSGGGTRSGLVHAAAETALSPRSCTPRPWKRPAGTTPSKPVAGEGRNLAMGLVMAQEMGDQITPRFGSVTPPSVDVSRASSAPMTRTSAGGSGSARTGLEDS